MRKALVTRGVSVETAEDIAQETAIRAWSRADAFDNRRSLERWCFKVAWNLATDDWRAQRRRGGALPEDQPAPDDVERQVQFRVAEAELLRALKRLPSQQRAAVMHWLRRLDDPSIEDTAADRRRRYATRQQLARMLKNYPAVCVIRLRHWLWQRADDGVRWATTLSMPIVLPIAASLLGISPPEPPPAVTVRTVATSGLAVSESSGGGRAVPAAEPVGSAVHQGARQTSVPNAPERPPLREDRLVRYAGPGGVDTVSFTPNPPAKPLICAGVNALGVCVDKPRLGPGPPDSG